MRIEQRVQVEIMGAPRPYSYAWHFDPATEKPVQLGDIVELPPNQVQEEGSSGKVIALGTSYTGELKSIVRVIRGAYEESPKGDDLWAAWGQGDYA